MIYCALVQSLLSYGILAWGACRSNALHNLLITQKYIIKNMLRLPRLFSTDLLFDEKNFLSIRHLYLKKALHYFFRTRHTHERSQQTRVTRRMLAHNYIEPFRSSVFGQRCYAYLAPRFFNRLPDSIKNLESMGSFKSKSSGWVQDIPYRMLGEILGFVP